MAGDDDLWADEDDFSIPPPPPPPSFCSSGEGEGPFFCRLEGGGGPMGAHFDRGAGGFPSLPVLAVCSSVVLVAVLVASFLFWRHKSKVQNLLPCKSEVQQQGCHHGGELGAANGVTYEDILAGHQRTHLQGSQTLMPLEILDVKLGDISPSQMPSLHHPPLYPGRGKPPFHHHPVYEEVSQATTDKSTADKLGNHTSEEEFDEGGSATSSVRGSTGGDLCRDPVSSDEGDSSSYAIDNMPKIVPGDNSFGYPRRQNNTTYPLPERTDFRSHSNQPDGKRHVVVSPSHLRPFRGQRGAMVVPPVVDPRSMAGAQWLRQDRDSGSHGQDMGFPASASQENIYSTIDEDEDYPPQPALTSLACAPRGGGSPAGKKGVKPVRGGPLPLSQRNPEENGSSYGDIMPAFHSASFM